MPNYLLQLPSTITNLKTSPLAPHICDNVFTVDTMLSQLPKSLLHFTMASTFTHISHVMDMALSKTPDFVNHMPPHLETMAQLVVIPIIPTTIAIIRSLPSTLTQLNLLLQGKDSISALEHVSLSPSLKHLTLRVRAISSNDGTRVWHFISHLRQLESLVFEGDPSISSSNKVMFDNDTWRTILPSKLKHFHFCHRLPIQWSTVKHDSVIIPATVQILFIHEIDLNDMITHAPQGIPTLTRLSARNGPVYRGCHLNQSELQCLPNRSIRQLDIFMVPSMNFVSFDRLVELHLVINGNHDIPINLEFPPTLRSLTVRTFGRFISLDEVAHIVKALPPLLEHFYMHDIISFHWWCELVACLPRGLLSLDLFSCHLSEKNWMSCIATLPSGLTRLDMSVHQLDDIDILDSLMDALPLGIKHFSFGYYYKHHNDSAPTKEVVDRLTTRFCSRRSHVEAIIIQ